MSIIITSLPDRRLNAQNITAQLTNVVIKMSTSTIDKSLSKATLNCRIALKKPLFKPKNISKGYNGRKQTITGQ
jgi:hypothetical protein